MPPATRRAAGGVHIQTRVASSAWLFRPRSWPLHWPRMAAVARGLAQSQTIASRSSVVACCTTKNGSPSAVCPDSLNWPTVAVASSRGGVLEYRASLVRTEYEAAASALRSALDARRAALRPGTFGRGPPSQSANPVGDRGRQSITSPRCLWFAAWSSAAPLAGGPGRSGSSLLRLRRRRQPSVSGTLHSLGRPLHARRAVLHDLDAALAGRLRRGRCACPSPPLAS